MMTIEEKLKMYREKRQFIYNVAMAFVKSPKGHTVEDITYEVWHKKSEAVDRYGDYFTEWVIVHFTGGAKAYERVSGNSNVANFQVISKLVNGGYYEEKCKYNEQVKLGYKRVDLTKLVLTEVD